MQDIARYGVRLRNPEAGSAQAARDRSGSLSGGWRQTMGPELGLESGSRAGKWARAGAGTFYFCEFACFQLGWKFLLSL